MKKAILDWWIRGASGASIPSGSFLFNAGTDYLVSSDASLLNDQIKGTAQKFSISIWCRRSTIDATVQTIFSRDNSSGGRQFACEFDTAETWTFFIADDADNYSWYKTTGAFTNTNSWYHFVITFDNTLAVANKCKLYVNGVLETISRTDVGAGVSDVNDQPLEPIYIGVTNFVTLVNPFKGYVGEINFYTDILTQSDVTALFNSGTYKNARSTSTSVAPYMNWTPAAATFGANWTMGDNMGTSYGVSKNFVSSGLVEGDRSLSVVPDTTTYGATSSGIISAMTTAPSLRDKYIIDQTVTNITNDGDWATLVDIGFTAAHAQQAARLKWKALTEITEVATPTFTQDRGYTFNGTTQYLTSGIILSSGGAGLFTLNSGCIGTYNRLNINAANVTIGCNDATNGAVIVPRNAGNCAGRINGGAGINLSAAAANSQGLVTVRRTTAAAQAIFRNGASVVTNTGATAAVPTVELYIGATNNNGTPGNLSTNEIAAWFVSSGAISQANIYLRIQQYMMSKGANV